MEKKNILQLNLHSEYFPTPPPKPPPKCQQEDCFFAFIVLVFVSFCFFGGGERRGGKRGRGRGEAGGWFLSEITLNDRKQQQASTATCVFDTDIPKLNAQT